MSSATGARILVIDDNPVNVTLLRKLLGTGGFVDIHALTDPTAAVDVFSRLQPDIVLLDLHMPELDGHEVLAQLTAQQGLGFVPIVVVTADVTREARDRALAAGAQDFLTKPVDRVELLLRVRNQLAVRALYVDSEAKRHILEAEVLGHRRAAEDRAEMLRSQQQRISSAFDTGALNIAVQPILDLRTDRICGVEALARFQLSPPRPPDEWFAEAWAVGEGRQLEAYAAERALEQLPFLPEEWYLAINFSADTLNSGRAHSALLHHAERVVIELTEHAQVTDYQALRDALEPLRTAGARLSVDDTGAGFASLRHILRLRPDIIKLDRELTTEIDTDPVKRALATALITFAHDIHATIVAEGVETSQELHTLRALGVHCAQGYHVGRPAPASQHHPNRTQPRED